MMRKIIVIFVNFYMILLYQIIFINKLLIFVKYKKFSFERNKFKLKKFIIKISFIINININC